jgi:hypothetical protein
MLLEWQQGSQRELPLKGDLWPQLKMPTMIVHKDYVYRIMTRAGISVVGNAFDQLFILHKK